VDGAWQIDGGAGMSPTANRAKATQSVKRAHEGTKNDAILRDFS
jgi:hypothetical protein